MHSDSSYLVHSDHDGYDTSFRSDTSFRGTFGTPRQQHRPAPHAAPHHDRFAPALVLPFRQLFLFLSRAVDFSSSVPPSSSAAPNGPVPKTLPLVAVTQFLRFVDIPISWPDIVSQLRSLPPPGGPSFPYGPWSGGGASAPLANGFCNAVAEVDFIRLMCRYWLPALTASGGGAEVIHETRDHSSHPQGSHRRIGGQRVVPPSSYTTTVVQFEDPSSGSIDGGRDSAGYRSDDDVHEIDMSKDPEEASAISTNSFLIGTGAPPMMTTASNRSAGGVKQIRVLMSEPDQPYGTDPPAPDPDEAAITVSALVDIAGRGILVAAMQHVREHSFLSFSTTPEVLEMFVAFSAPTAQLFGVFERLVGVSRQASGMTEEREAKERGGLGFKEGTIPWIVFLSMMTHLLGQRDRSERFQQHGYGGGHERQGNIAVHATMIIFSKLVQELEMITGVASPHPKSSLVHRRVASSSSSSSGQPINATASFMTMRRFSDILMCYAVSRHTSNSSIVQTVLPDTTGFAGPETRERIMMSPSFIRGALQEFFSEIFGDALICSAWMQSTELSSKLDPSSSHPSGAALVTMTSPRSGVKGAAGGVLHPNVRTCEMRCYADIVSTNAEDVRKRLWLDVSRIYLALAFQRGNPGGAGLQSLSTYLPKGGSNFGSASLQCHVVDATKVAKWIEGSGISSYDLQRALLRHAGGRPSDRTAPSDRAGLCIRVSTWLCYETARELDQHLRTVTADAGLDGSFGSSARKSPHHPMSGRMGMMAAQQTPNKLSSPPRSSTPRAVHTVGRALEERIRTAKSPLKAYHAASDSGHALAVAAAARKRRAGGASSPTRDVTSAAGGIRHLHISLAAFHAVIQRIFFCTEPSVAELLHAPDGAQTALMILNFLEHKFKDSDRCDRCFIATSNMSHSSGSGGRSHSPSKGGSDAATLWREGLDLSDLLPTTASGMVDMKKNFQSALLQQFVARQMDKSRLLLHSSPTRRGTRSTHDAHAVTWSYQDVKDLLSEIGVLPSMMSFTEVQRCIVARVMLMDASGLPPSSIFPGGPTAVPSACQDPFPSRISMKFLDAVLGCIAQSLGRRHLPGSSDAAMFLAKSIIALRT